MFHRLVDINRDDACKVWDCKQEEEIGTYDCKQLPQDLHWNYNGSLFCVSTKDKMDRIFDPRQNIVVQEWTPHEGTKCSKMVWIGDTQHIITTGFNRGSQREWKMWDLRNLKKPICSDSLDMVYVVKMVNSSLRVLYFLSMILIPRFCSLLEREMVISVTTRSWNPLCILFPNTHL